MDKYKPGDTWVFIDPNNGNQGIVWLQEESAQAKGSRFYFERWYWHCQFSDGSTPIRHYDSTSNKAKAVYECSVKLYGMGSHKTRFKFNPNFKFGDLITGINQNDMETKTV
jgi:hypothetical protein